MPRRADRSEKTPERPESVTWGSCNFSVKQNLRGPRRRHGIRADRGGGSTKKMTALGPDTIDGNDSGISSADPLERDEALAFRAQRGAELGDAGRDGEAVAALAETRRRDIQRRGEWPDALTCRPSSH